MKLEEAFGMRLHYVRDMVSDMAKRLESESWQFLPEYLDTAKHELATLTLMWGELKAKRRESEADQCQSK